jgi:outer membrane protein TolC
MRINAEVTSAIARARVLKEVSDSFRTAVLPRLETNERLTEAAFRTGTLSFSEVLSQQREVLAAREEMLALSHRAAVAAAEAAAAAMSPPFTESSLHNHTPLPSGKDTP